MTSPPPTDRQSDEYVAIIDQDAVTDEVRDIAVNYDPLNRSGHEGFHVADDGELHIDDSKVMGAHALIEQKIPNDAIRIVPLPTETGQLVHQYGENGFRLYDLPAPADGSVIGLLGRNGIGKTTALRIVAGELVPNFGTPAEIDWEEAVESFRGTALQTHLERLRDGAITAASKPQRVDAPSETDDETVRQRLRSRSTDPEQLIDELDLRPISGRPVGDLSGGERQRVAIASTLLRDADLYLFDEPSSFLDAQQRATVSRVIHERIRDTDSAAIVIEHDLAMLDLVSDGIHVLYGDAGGFGVVSQRLSVREGINQFLDGYLAEENVQIRGDAIEFPAASGRGVPLEDPVFEYPALQTEFTDFTLSVDPGAMYAGESIGIVGENGLGKTTFVKLLAGSIDADSGSVPGERSISYKPQNMRPDSQATVRDRFAAVTDIHSRRFQTWIRDPFDLEMVYDRRLDSLSGGELQRVAVALCLARDAELYLIDEPSAFLDVDRRVSLADEMHRFSRRTDRPVIVVDHDLFVIDRVADRLVVFEGTPGERGHANPPRSVRDGMNAFLSSLGITFRRDERTGRPRVNTPGSRLDREQKASGDYYYATR